MREVLYSLWLIGLVWILAKMVYWVQGNYTGICYVDVAWRQTYLETDILPRCPSLALNMFMRFVHKVAIGWGLHMRYLHMCLCGPPA